MGGFLVEDQLNGYIPSPWKRDDQGCGKGLINDKWCSSHKDEGVLTKIIMQQF